MRTSIILASLVLAATIPTTALAIAQPDGTGVCADDLYHAGYTECYGVSSNCPGGAGVAHWYKHVSGASHTWCYLYVQSGGEYFLAVCTDADDLYKNCFGVESQ